MIELVLVGIGAGNFEHVTLEGVGAINSADLILVPRKGAEKADLANMRHAILARTLTNQSVRIIEFDMSRRDPSIADYETRVAAWHAAIADAWQRAIGDARNARVVLLVWGDPSLYDSTLRIAALMTPAPRVRVAPGVTALQALTAAHAIPLNEVGKPFLVTTGRRLREAGWPDGVDTIAVLLDDGTALAALDAPDALIWWGAFLGMPGQILAQGRLADVRGEILRRREAARAQAGWIMDVYILRRA